MLGSSEKKGKTFENCPYREKQSQHGTQHGQLCKLHPKSNSIFFLEIKVDTKLSKTLCLCAYIACDRYFAHVLPKQTISSRNSWSQCLTHLTSYLYNRQQLAAVYFTCNPCNPSLESLEDISPAQIYHADLNSVVFFLLSFVVIYSYVIYYIVIYTNTYLFQIFQILFFSVSFFSCRLLSLSSTLYLFPLSVFAYPLLSLFPSVSFFFCLLLFFLLPSIFLLWFYLFIIYFFFLLLSLSLSSTFLLGFLLLSFFACLLLYSLLFSLSFRVCVFYYYYPILLFCTFYLSIFCLLFLLFSSLSVKFYLFHIPTHAVRCFLILHNGHLVPVLSLLQLQLTCHISSLILITYFIISLSQSCKYFFLSHL